MGAGPKMRCVRTSPCSLVWPRRRCCRHALVALLPLWLCGWMYARQRDLIYYPQPRGSTPAQTDFALARDGVTLRGWVVNAGPARRGDLLRRQRRTHRDRRDNFARWFPRAARLSASPIAASAPATARRRSSAYERRPGPVRPCPARGIPGTAIDVIGRSLGSGRRQLCGVAAAGARGWCWSPRSTAWPTSRQAHYPWLPVRLAGAGPLRLGRPPGAVTRARCWSCGPARTR